MQGLRKTVKDFGLLGVPAEIQIDHLKYMPEALLPEPTCLVLFATEWCETVIQGELAMPVFRYSGICIWELGSTENLRIFGSSQS